PGWKTDLPLFSPAPSPPAAERFPVGLHWENLRHPHHRPTLHCPPRKNKLQGYFLVLPKQNCFDQSVFLHFPAVPSVFLSDHPCLNDCCILPQQYCTTKTNLKVFSS